MAIGTNGIKWTQKNSEQGFGNYFQVGGGGGKGAATRKLPIPNSSFSLDFSHLILKIPPSSKKNLNILSYFFIKVEWASPLCFAVAEGQLPHPCSRAHDSE